jgi:ribokinase
MDVLIAAVGPALVDHLYLIDRFPEPGGHTVVKSSKKMPGGAAGNVIYGLSRFGLRCRFYSTIGRDYDAEFFIKEMKEAGVDVKVEVTHPETGRCDVYIDRSGERTFFVHPNASRFPGPSIGDGELKEIDYLYLDPFPSEDSFSFHMDLARRAEGTVLLNPGFPYTSIGFDILKELLEHIDIVFISRDELALCNATPEEFLQYVDLVIITMGKEGSRALTKDEDCFSRGFEVKAVDTTGAGDAFAAGFIYAFVRGIKLEGCLKTGNFVASFSVQHVGGRNFPEKRVVDELIDKLK